MNDFQNDGDTLQLRRVLDFVVESRRWLAGGLLLGLAFAITYLAVTPKEYEAQGVLRMGKTLGRELESPIELAERLKSRDFYTAEVQKTCGIELLEDDSTSRTRLSKYISTKIQKQISTIVITYKGRDPDLAKQCLSAVIEHVIYTQEKSAEPFIVKAKKNLDLTEAHLLDAQKTQSKLATMALSNFRLEDNDFSKQLLFIVTNFTKGDQIVSLRKAVLDERFALDPPQTQNAELILPISASRTPVYPKKLPILTGSLLAGLVLGGLAFFIHGCLRSRHSIR